MGTLFRINDSENIQLIQGDTREELKSLPDNTVQSCITSPPYWGMRDYGINNQIGAEESLEQYIAELKIIFSQVRRILTDDGT